MTEIEKKALALVNEVTGLALAPPFNRDHPYGEALCRAIEELEVEKAARAAEREQHEAFRQEVSDAVESTLHSISHWQGCDVEEFRAALSRSIIAKPDPLADALGELADRNLEARQAADTLRAAIEKRGGKIVWGEG